MTLKDVLIAIKPVQCKHE